MGRSAGPSVHVSDVPSRRSVDNVVGLRVDQASFPLSNALPRSFVIYLTHSHTLLSFFYFLLDLSPKGVVSRVTSIAACPALPLFCAFHVSFT